MTVKEAELPVLLSAAEVASWLHVPRDALGEWYRAGIGPPVTWLSRAALGYRREDVTAWLAGRYTTICRDAFGLWRATFIVDRSFVASETFDTKRQALAWLKGQRDALVGDLDPSAGTMTVERVMVLWLRHRRTSVTRNAFFTDRAVLRLSPLALRQLRINAVTERGVSRVLVALKRHGIDEPRVRQYSASLATFFGWAIQQRLASRNPVDIALRPTYEGELAPATAHRAPTWTDTADGSQRPTRRLEVVPQTAPGAVVSQAVTAQPRREALSQAQLAKAPDNYSATG